MKAAVHREYGPPDVVQIEDVEKPVANDNEVLIEVRAASVNPLDWHFMRGKPYIVRLFTGLRKPRNPRMGRDLAGRVEAVGKNVRRFHPGDEVFGAGGGAFADYACVRENALSLKPTNLTFEQAAAVPVAAISALQGVRDKGRIQLGQKVLINGAAGGVGTFAVQIAKSFGADVTGVCSTRNVNMVRSIGADRVIDYTREDFTESGERYDFIFDCVGNRSLSDLRRVMSPRAISLGFGAPKGQWIAPLTGALKALVWSMFRSQKLVGFIASINNQDLVVLKELIESKKVTPVIDRRYRLSEAPEAIRYLEEGHARGKVVITLEKNNQT
ncbi:MAG TPA: NAD(P)-dependent alcohol dehydrogenase [Candidatus Acidoferrales bacterium]|jgi:NADPH:quinone reductase-like Zn-dependent oxidoreductase|nr:NAD(P)-dependent alcohol dehydrogenase [Candidatus Acidoferrales bacterium]